MKSEDKSSLDAETARALLVASVDHAMFMTLRGKPVTNNGSAFVNGVSDLLLQQEESLGSRRNRGKKTPDFKAAISAVIIDLIHAATRTVEVPNLDNPVPTTISRGWAYHGRNTIFFRHTDHGISKHLFVQCITALGDAGLLEFMPGISYFDSNFTGKDGKPYETHKASRYRATDALLAMAESNGLKPGNYGVHFKYRLPENVVELREPSKWGDHPKGGRKKEKGKRIRLSPSPELEAIAELVREINTRLESVEVGGGRHWAFRLIFNDGIRERPTFNRGGRLYSSGPDSYQQDSKAQRLAMTLDGEPVCEIDISSSHLTILWGLYWRQFPNAFAEVWREPDLYRLPGINHRGVGKSWFTLAMGWHKEPSRWSPERVADFRRETGEDLKAHKVAEVGKLMLAKHPVIGQWLSERDKNSKDLQYVEGKIILLTMLRLLREYRIPALPVFDSLVVKQKDAEIVAAVLKAEFEDVADMLPRLKVNLPPGHSLGFEINDVPPARTEQQKRQNPVDF